ncbi:MAG: hypothetical protein Q8Q60_05290 [Candidatus Chromulinivorax sp.]|nr:hypothetical protein [Candidatus Chromulinivorax sp.]
MEYKKRMKRLLLILLVNFNVYGNQNNEKPVCSPLLFSLLSQDTQDIIKMLLDSSYNPRVDNNLESLHSILKQKTNENTETLLDARLLTPDELCAINTQINARKTALPGDSNKPIKKRPVDWIIDDPKINEWFEKDQKKGMRVDVSLLIDQLERNQI